MNNRFKKVTILVILFYGVFTLFSKNDLPTSSPKATTIISYSAPRKPQPIFKSTPIVTTTETPKLEEELDDGIIVNPESSELFLTDVYQNSDTPNNSIHSFKGQLELSEMNIEILVFSINDQDYDLSLTPLHNNTFEYYLGDETISGIIYQTNELEYIVSFVTGPLSGMKLEFKTQITLNESDMFAIEDRINNPE